MESRSSQKLVVTQQFLGKISIIFLSVGVSLLANLIAGYLGGISGFNIAINSSYSLSFLSMTAILVIWGALAVYKNFAKSLLPTLFGFLVVTSVTILIAKFRSPGLPHSYFLLTFAYTIVGLLICTATLFANRFTISMIDILFLKSRVLKISTAIMSVGSSILGAYIGATLLRNTGTADENINKALSVLSEADLSKVTLIAISTGLSYGLALILGGWWANYRQGTPWRYPDLLRDWSLAIGTFGGKSFYDLDMSERTFQNTKLANSDLRARKLYRTCFQGAIGLERSRVDNQYLDLEYPKVQHLLTHGSSRDRDFRGFNLQGAYLQNADLRGFDFTDTNLTGADLKGADLRESILVRTQLAGVDLQEVDLRKNIVIDANLTEANFHRADLRGCILVRAQVARADFTGADLTGVCIEDWSVSSKTRFIEVRCDYIYRKYQDGQPSDRYPVDRNFEPGEFASLFAEPEDIVELVFKGEFDIAALSLALYKLQSDAPELNLELRGVEQRGNLWVAKIKTSTQLNERLITERLTSVYQAPNLEATIKTSIYRDYEETRQRLAESEQLVKQLAGVTGSQAEALKELSKRALGNNFFISGSTITNLTGSGQIEYNEAAQQIRQLVTNQTDPNPILQELRDRKIALTPETQTEFIQQMLLSEAEKDSSFRQFLLQQGSQMMENLPESIAIAISSTIAQLNQR